MSTFLQQAERGRTSGWWFLGSLVVIAVVALIGGSALAAGVLALLGSGGSAAGGYTPEGLGLSPPAFIAVAVAPHAFALLGLWVCVRVFHRRPFRTLITGASHIDGRRLGFAAAVWGGLLATAIGLGIAVNPDNYQLVFEPIPFLTTLAAILVCIPIQAATEELVLRGLVMQESGRLLGSGWAALLVSSGLFGILHGANPEVQSFGVATMLSYYVGFGLLMGALTLVDGRLELALGIHVANNVLSLALVTYPSTVLPVPALVRMETVNPILVVWSLAAAGLVFTALAARRYGWTWADVRHGLGGMTPEPEGEERRVNQP